MKSFQRILPGLIGLLLSVVFLLGEETANTERLEIRGGAVLVGMIIGQTGEKVLLQTPYAGVLEIDAEQIENLPDIQVLEEKAVLAQAAPKPAPVKKKSGKAHKPAPRPSGRWAFEGAFNLNGKRGNSDKFDLRVKVDAKLERAHDRVDLYAQYAYGTNRGKLSSDEMVLGVRYTNFFYDGLGMFFREELEQDDFEGIYVRSTSASGISWRIRNEEDLLIEARSGFSYRYEKYEEEGEKDFPGMDFGVDVNWRFARWVRFKGSLTYLPSISDFDDYIIEQDSGFNLPLDVSNMWKLRFGIASKYNSQPEEQRLRLDHRYYAQLVASWK